MVLLTLDYTAVSFKILSVVGVVLGVLGLIYASYSIVKRHVAASVLGRFLQVVTPIVFTATLYGTIGGLLFRFVTRDPRVTPDIIFAEALLYAAAGALIGAFNGFFIDPFQTERDVFSFRHFLGGAVLTFVLIFAGWIVLGTALAPNPTDPQLALQAGLQVALKNAAILAPVGAVLAGFWRFINNPRLYRHRYVKPLPPDSIRLFSWSGALIGFLTAFVFGLCITFVGNLTFLNLVNNPRLADDLRLIVLNSLGASLIYAVIGALNGSFARHFFQWVNVRFGDDRIGVVGFVITIFGFFLQFIQTLQDLMSTLLNG